MEQALKRKKQISNTQTNIDDNSEDNGNNNDKAI